MSKASNKVVDEVKIPCPYCGGRCHRKAVQTIKGVGAYRRHYCVDGCGHYHYRDVETDAVVEVGNGPRECRLHPRGDEGLNEQIETLKRQLAEARGALKVSVDSANETKQVDPVSEIAANLGITPDLLTFTSVVNGNPRAIVLCLSDAEFAALETDEDREAVKTLHRALLTTQAAIKAYREKAKGKK